MLALVSAIIVCVLIIMTFYLSIKLDYANGEIEFYKKENVIIINIDRKSTL